MLERRIEGKLRKHFLTEKNALLLTGARQTGKTFSIRKTGRECFENFVEINFLEDEKAVKLFENAGDAKSLLLGLSALFGRKLVPGKTLIFFDEVQECKEIVTAIKFLVEEGSYRYVLSGSLLGVELKDIRSVPVGYMSVMDMYPLDFEEFALCCGVSPEVLDHLRECFAEGKAVDAFVHQKMMELLRLYLLVGGMPAAVQKYIDTNNLKKVYAEQREIVRLYKKDIAKYDSADKLKIGEVYELMPSELNAQNKRFILKDLGEQARFRGYENTLLWLKDSGVAIPVYNVEEPKSPLLLNKQHNLMKLFMNDVGLLSSMYAGDIQARVMSGQTDINFGAVYENLAAQELYAHGWAGDLHNLFYFSSKKQGELDFVIEQDGAILPIEIKSGKNYHRHNALDNALRNPDYGVQRAYVFCQDNVKRDDRVLYLPIYMLMFLRKEEMPEVIYKFDPAELNVSRT